jgi:hypothetical protein
VVPRGNPGGGIVGAWVAVVAGVCGGGRGGGQPGPAQAQPGGWRARAANSLELGAGGGGSAATSSLVGRQLLCGRGLAALSRGLAGPLACVGVGGVNGNGQGD